MIKKIIIIAVSILVLSIIYAVIFFVYTAKPVIIFNDEKIIEGRKFEITVGSCCIPENEETTLLQVDDILKFKIEGDFRDLNFYLDKNNLYINLNKDYSNNIIYKDNNVFIKYD